MPDPTPAFRRHDHTDCTARALAEVRAVCARRGLRLTETRARVMEILLESHRALGAYAILDRLRGSGRKAQPPVAYRALDFLVEHGFAHRIEKLNAFVACTGDHAGGTPAFLICRGCDRVAETAAPSGDGRIGRKAREIGFEIEHTVVEVEGLCPECRDGA